MRPTILIIAAVESVIANKRPPSYPHGFWLTLCFLGCVVYAFIARDEVCVSPVSSLLIGWLTAFCVSQMYVKPKIEGLSLSTWTHVAYTNALAALFTLPFCYYEWRRYESKYTSHGMILISLSCMISCGFAYYSETARTTFSAALAPLLGTACDFGSLVGNQVLWSRHGTYPGVAAASVVLGASCAYGVFAKRSVEIPEGKSLSSKWAW